MLRRETTEGANRTCGSPLLYQAVQLPAESVRLTAHSPSRLDLTQNRSGLDELELEVDLDLVGDEELSPTKDGFEGHSEVLAVDSGGGR